MRHGARASASANPNGQRLGCYYCNDIVAPADVSPSSLFAHCSRTHAPVPHGPHTRPNVHRHPTGDRLDCLVDGRRAARIVAATPRRVCPSVLLSSHSFTLRNHAGYTLSPHHPNPPPLPPGPPTLTPPPPSSASSHTNYAASSHNFVRCSSRAQHTTAAQGAPRPSSARTSKEASGRCSGRATKRGIWRG